MLGNNIWSIVGFICFCFLLYKIEDTIMSTMTDITNKLDEIIRLLKKQNDQGED